LAPDLVIEAAGNESVLAHGPLVVASGIHFLPMSVEALADPRLLTELTELANQYHTGILIPSGAIGGLDVLRASRARGELNEVLLTSTKPAAALIGQPFLIEQGISLEGLERAVSVFDGPASAACIAFPKSTNIAAAVSLAGLGFDRTRVRVVADPHILCTTHSLQAKGAFGELQLTLRSFPHPKNPKTTSLACLGAVAAVKNVGAAIRFI